MASSTAAVKAAPATVRLASAKAFPDWLLGVSFAATWTWAVSVLVGMALLREQGIIPFFTWFAANVAAIPLFGYVSRRFPWLWAETRRPLMRVVMTVMLMLTFWINLTGIVTMGDTLEWLSHGANVAIAIATGLFLWAVTRRWGILWSVLSDRVEWWGLYGAVITALAVTVAQDGFHLDATLKLGSYSTFRDWWLALWTVPLLLTNPYIDGSFWQRAKYADSMRPYWWGFGMFFTYLCLVAALGLLGPTPLALALLYVVVYFAATSTMDSALTGMQLTAGRRAGVIAGLLCIGLWYTVSSIGLLSLWAAMFSWYPVMFAWLALTHRLERRRVLKPVPAGALAARDGLPLIVMGHRVKGGAMTIQKADWELIRIHYTQGRENGSGVEWPTLEQLAIEYDVPAPTIRSRAHREGWRQARNIFHTELIHKTREKTLEELSDKLTQADQQAFSVARAAMAVASKQLFEGAQHGTLKLADQERLLRICDMAHRMARRAAGIGQAE